jgi:oligosaccharide repeat unit polymerase
MYLYLSIFFLIITNLFIFKFDKQPFNRSPLKMFSIATAVFYTFPAVVIGVFSFESMFFSLNRELLVYQNFIIILFISIVFVSSILIPNSKKKYVNFEFKENKVVVISVFLIVIGGITKLYLFKLGLYSLEDTFNESYRNIPRVLVFLRNIDLWGYIFLSIIVCKYLHVKKYSFIKFIFFSEIIFLIVFSILQGRRTGAVLPIIIFILCYSFYHKLKIKKFLAPLIISLVLIVSTTFNRLLETGTFSSSQIRNLIFEAIFSRLANTYIILNKVIDHGPLANYDSFELSFVGLIPSVFLTDKPSLSIGNEFGKELGLLNVNNVTTGINPGWIGESYYNSGIIGIFVGAIIFSLLINYFYKKSFFENDSSKIFLVMLFIFIFSGYQMEVAASLNNFLKGYLILIFISGFIPRLTFNK